MVDFLRGAISNFTNVSPIATVKKANEGSFAGYSTNKLLAESGLSTNEQSRVLSSVSANSTKGVTSGTTYESSTGQKYKESDIIILPDGAGPHIVLPDGSYEAVNPITVTGATDRSSTPAQATQTVEQRVDNRLRLSALEGREGEVYGEKTPDNILNPLRETGGLLFPFTPSLQMSGEANWSAHELTHTNFDVLSYQRTPSATIGITGKFSVQNQREGEYALAAIHFLRSTTKMYYGDQESAQANAAENRGKDAKAGLPPPVLRLRGYGEYMFPDLRCVVKGYSFSFDENMDLIDIALPSGGNVLLPPLFSITVNIALQQSPKRARKDFNLSDFRTGKTMKIGGNWF